MDGFVILLIINTILMVFVVFLIIYAFHRQYIELMNIGEDEEE